MIKVIDNEKNEDIIEFELSGVVSGDDYEKVLIPAIEQKIKTVNKLKILYHLSKDFDSYEFKAMFDDAKAGFKFWDNWERIAVVSDVEWVNNSVKAFSFISNGKLKVYNNIQIDEARKWLLEGEVLDPNIKVILDKDSKMVILELKEHLSKDDFLYAKTLIDPFIAKEGSLSGLILYSKDFPGWDSFSAFKTHMEFIKEHHKKVKKLAFVMDSFIGTIAQNVGSHFVDTEVKEFKYSELNKAKEWITS